MKFSIKGLYFVTPDCADTEHLVAMVAQVLAGGAALVQYRNKTADAALANAQARALLALCRAAQVPLIINDHVSLALAIDADGVHLGQADGAIAAARSALGAHKIIGASCYNQLALAQLAQQQGADYAAFGACYPSPTKPHAPRATAALFSQAKLTLTLPLVAIGGITLENAPPLLNAGADALAVISDIAEAPHMSARVAQFSALFAG